MPAQKAFAFDFDGVLADSLDRFLIHAENVALELGYPRKPTRRDLDALDHMKVIDFGRQIALPESVVETFTERVYDLIAAYEDHLSIFEGMDAIVRQVAQSHPVAIVTANLDTVVQRFLQRFGLADEVSAIFGGEEGASKADKLKTFAKQANTQLPHVYMIGDAVSDVRAAHEAGTKAIAVTWGGQSFGKLVTAVPDYIVESPKALATLLHKLIT